MDETRAVSAAYDILIAINGITGEQFREVANNITPLADGDPMAELLRIVATLVDALDELEGRTPMPPAEVTS